VPALVAVLQALPLVLTAAVVVLALAFFLVLIPVLILALALALVLALVGRLDESTRKCRLLTAASPAGYH